MKRLRLRVILMGLWPGAGMAQTTDELINDRRNTDNVTTQSMGYDRKSYRPLAEINRSTVERLVPIWNASLMNDLGELAAPTGRHRHGIEREPAHVPALPVQR